MYSCYTSTISFRATPSLAQWWYQLGDKSYKQSFSTRFSSLLESQLFCSACFTSIYTVWVCFGSFTSARWSVHHFTLHSYWSVGSQQSHWNAYPTLLVLYEFCLRLGWFKDQYNFEPLLLRDLVPWVWSNDQKISAWHITCLVSQLLSGKFQEKIEAESTRWLKKNNKKKLFFLVLSQNQHFNPPNSS